MIELMRSKAASWVAKILAFFLIASFAVWGIGDMFRAPGPDTTVAEIGDIKITRDELSQQIGRLLNVLRSRLGPDFDTQQAAELGLIDQTVDQMVNARLLGLEAKNMGLGAGDELVRQTILRDPRFIGVGNRFDRSLYEQFLRQENMPEGYYVSRLREEIMQRQVTSAISASVRVPQTLLDTLYRYRNEKRVAAYVSIPYIAPNSIKDPADSVLMEFYTKNPARFTASEFRTLTAIYLDPAVVANDLTPGEERMKEEYQFRKDTLSVPERRDLEQVLLQDEEQAKKLSQALATGKLFADAAKEIAGVTPTQLGNLRQDDLPKEIATAAFALTGGATSVPIKTALGWHLVRVKIITPGKTPTFDSIKEKIRKDIATELAVDTIIKLTGKLDDALAGGARIEGAASGIGVDVVTIGPVDAQGMGPDDKPVANLPQGAQFLQSVFTTPEGETTTVEETPDGRFYVLRVDGVTPPALKPLDLVRKLAGSIWKMSEVRKATEAKARKLLEAAKAAGGISTAAKTAGLSVKTSKPFSRFIRPEGSEISDGLSGELFKATKGGIVTAPDEKGYAIAELTEVIAAEPGKNKAEADALAAQMKTIFASDSVSQFLTGLQSKYTVQINRGSIQNLVTGQSGGR
jgi:peptidyl-prolyl cis-trans isomerase D